MISVIYTYRDKDLNRVKKSLDSLKNQTSLNFEVIFIDYGSKIPYSTELKNLLSNYNFVNYFYTYSKGQPWSRSKALNIGINHVKSEFVFMSDVDMIYSPIFIETILKLRQEDTVNYFKVGFLSQSESLLNKPFSEYTIKFYSKKGAYGMALFPFKVLKSIGGYDEFFHFWGAEDEDIINRCKINGVSLKFCNQVLMNHQWHQTYRNYNDKILTEDLRVTNISKVNHAFLKYKIKNKLNVNYNFSGKIITQNEYKALDNITKKVVVSNAQENIQSIPALIKNIKNEVLEIRIINKKLNIKQRIKAFLKSKDPLIPLKKVNDILLLELISHYNDKLYDFKVDLFNEQLVLKIEL